MTDEHSHHNHAHVHTKNKKALRISFILIASYMLIEFVGGYLTNSLALLSDASHMLSDAVALGLSLTALVIGEKVATSKKTFGYKRFEILAALLNGAVLILLAIYIIKEAIERFSHPVEVMGKGMMIISTIGLIVNVVVVFILSQAQTKDNLNIKSAFMHVIGDLLGSVGAITAAILIILFDWYIADPIASIIVSVLVLYSGWNILKESIHILMEGKPAQINSEELTTSLQAIPLVVNVHDLHIWMITADFPTLTVHLNVNEGADRDLILKDAFDIIRQQTGIEHITIQVEGLNFNICKQNC